MDLFTQSNGNMKKAEIGIKNQEISTYFDLLFTPDPEYYPIDRYYFDERCQLSYSLWRLDRGATRFYFNPDEKSFHASVTSIISDQEPNKPWLNKWQDKMGGHDEAEYYKETRADYGDLMHILINATPIVGTLDTTLLEQAVKIYVRKNDIGFRDTRYWAEDLKNDLAGFYQWWHDYNVVPIASEIPIVFPIYHPRTGELVYKTAGTPDLICKMDAKNYKKTPKYKRKRVNAVIDFKSGRKGFWENHKIQREMYLKGWNWNMRTNIPDKRSTRSLVATHAGNWAPTNSRGNKTTYKFKMKKGMNNNRDHTFANWCDNFVQAGRHEVSPIRNIKGTFKLGDSTNDNIVFEDAADFMHNRWKEYQDAQEEKRQNPEPNE